MCRAIEEMIKQAAEQAAAKATLEESKRIACRMLVDGSFSLEEIVEYTDLSLDEVKALQAILEALKVTVTSS